MSLIATGIPRSGVPTALGFRCFAYPRTAVARTRALSGGGGRACAAHGPPAPQSAWRRCGQRRHHTTRATPENDPEASSGTAQARAAYRVVWDADNIAYTAENWAKITESLNGALVASIDVFACGGNAAALASSSRAVPRPPGGVLHVDISPLTNTKPLTDGRLIVTAMQHAAADAACNFVVVANDGDMAPLVTALRAQHRLVIVASFGTNPLLTAVASRNVKLSMVEPAAAAPAQPAAGGQSKFTRCADVLSMCTSRAWQEVSMVTQYVVRSRSAEEEGEEGGDGGEPTSLDRLKTGVQSRLPPDLVAGASIKKAIVGGLMGFRHWNSDQEAAVMELLIHECMNHIHRDVGYCLRTQRGACEGTLPDVLVVQPADQEGLIHAGVDFLKEHYEEHCSMHVA